MNKFITIIFLLFSIIFTANSQNFNFADKFDDADYYLLFEDYDKALITFLELYDYDSTNANINYNIGLCYISSNKISENVKAIKYLEKATSNIAKTRYKEGSYREKRAPIETYFHLANSYKAKHEFDLAIENFNLFLKFLGHKKSYYSANVKLEITACKNAKEIINIPISLNPEKLREELAVGTNTESCPVISKDGSRLVFSMGTHNNFPLSFMTLNIDSADYSMDSIYYSERVNGKWSEPINIMSDLHTTNQTVPVCISSDGNKLYLVRDDNDDGNIYYSDFVNGKWTKVKKLSRKINTNRWETHASLASGDSTLYFTSERRGGFGGLDIWKSDKKENGKWGKPVNLGPTINTPEDEETPVILDDGKTLFFSSQGHYGMGGLDIFNSTYKDGAWTKPLNVGYSINTVGNDLVYITKFNDEYAYAPLNTNEWRSNIFGGKDDVNDVYKVKINDANTPNFKIFGIITTINGNAINPKLTLIDTLTQEATSVKYEANKKEYSLESTFGVYELLCTAEGYKDFSKIIILPEIYTTTEMMINIRMVPVGDATEIASTTKFEYELKEPEILAENIKGIEPVQNYIPVPEEIKEPELVAENTESVNQPENINISAVENKEDKSVKEKGKDNISEKIAEVVKPEVEESNEERPKTDNEKSELIANNSKIQEEKADVKEDNDIRPIKEKSKIISENKESVQVDEILFAFESAGILPEYKSTLDKLANYMQNKKKTKIEIYGYCDAQGDADYNLYLSKQRANAVKTYLVDKGVNKNVINIKGKGESNPISSDANAVTRKFNRRIEFKVISQDTPPLKINKIKVPNNCLIGHENIAPKPIDSKLSYTKTDTRLGIKVRTILFEFNAEETKQNENIQILANYLKANPKSIIKLIGYSDLQGDQIYNKMLSKKRASYIRNIIVRKGVERDRIKIEGKGSSDLVSIDNSPETRKYNRRVEIEVVKQGATKLIVLPLKIPTSYRIK